MRLFSILFIAYVLEATVYGQENDNIIAHYLFPEFYTGNILFKTGDIEESKMNYNSLLEEMVFETNGTYLSMTNIGLIDTIYIQNRKFIPVGKVFYEVSLNTKVPLLIKYSCRIIPPGNPTAFGGTSETNSIGMINNLYQSGQVFDLKLPDDFKITPSITFYLGFKNKYLRIYKVKQVLKCFPGKEKEIKEFIKVNDTDLTNQKDMIDLITFCNK